MSRKARWLAEWRASAEKPIFYHIVSRVVERRFAFGSAEKEKFRTLMRMQEKFTGCRAVSYGVSGQSSHGNICWYATVSNIEVKNLLLCYSGSVLAW